MSRYSRLQTVFNIILFVLEAKSWLVLRENNNDYSYDFEGFSSRDIGDPLILTKYLINDEFDLARNKSRVKPFAGQVSSHSGFFQVDPLYNSSLFFWYFPAELEPSDAPVVVWMQGGPGGSSMYGLFLENGPYKLKNGRAERRHLSWSRTMHMVYIDNPVATGFSFTESANGYATDMEGVGSNLYQALVQFYQVFPELMRNPLFLAGESYAGKYCVALAHTIHNKNPYTNFKINLKGVVVNDGLIDPINQLSYGDFLMGIGLIDERQRHHFHRIERETKQYIVQEKYIAAFNSYIQILAGSDSLLERYTGFTNYYNYLKPDNEDISSEIEYFLGQNWVKERLHVGNLDFRSIRQTGDVYQKLIPDFMKSVATWLPELFNNYRFLFYSGQLDIIEAYSLTNEFLRMVDWCGAQDLSEARRIKMYVNDELSGYSKTTYPGKCYGAVGLAMIRNAGHMAIADQPFWTYELVSNFVRWYY